MYITYRTELTYEIALSIFEMVEDRDTALPVPIIKRPIIDSHKVLCIPWRITCVKSRDPLERNSLSVSTIINLRLQWKYGCWPYHLITYSSKRQSTDNNES